MSKTNLARLLERRPDGIFVEPFEQGEIGLVAATRCRRRFLWVKVPIRLIIMILTSIASA